MRLLLPTIFTIICLLGCHIKKKKSDLSESALMGRVRSLKEVCYKTENRFGESKKSELLSIIVSKYSEDGFLIELTDFGSDGKIDRYESYTRKDSITHKKTTLYLDNDIYRRRYTKYINRHQVYFEDIGDNGTLCEIDSNFQFDQFGNLIGSITYSSFLPNRSSYSEVLSITSLDLSGKREYQYDTDGNIITEMIWTNIDGDPTTKKYKYDNGSLIESEYNGVNFISKVSYDKQGNMKEETTTYKDSEHVSVTRYTYERYDSNGNWLKKTVRYDNGRGFVTEREIEYY